MRTLLASQYLTPRSKIAFAGVVTNGPAEHEATMANGISRGLIILSTVGLLAAIALWLLAPSINDQSQQVSLGSNLHLTASCSHYRRWYRNLDRELLLFNDLKNSPHRGLIAYHVTERWSPLPGISILRSGPGFLGTAPGSGIPQRDLRWFTAYVSLYYPITLFAITPAIWLIRRYRRYRRGGRGFPVVTDPAAWPSREPKPPRSPQALRVGAVRG